MKYKALMLDLDGTTVPHFTDSLSERVIKRVRQAHEVVTVCIVTGRLLDQALPLIETLEITGPCAINNGAQIYDPLTHKILSQLFIVPEHVGKIYQLCREFTQSIVLFDGEKEHPGDTWADHPNVISFYMPDITPQAVASIAEAIKVFPDTTTNRMLGRRPGVESIEVVHGNATKQYGIYEVAKILGIDTHEIIAVGDGFNDFPLLMAAGLKIAMGNAVQELKDVADYIAPSVDEDGVAAVIEKFILEQ